MKLNEIQELIKFVSKSGVCEVELEMKDFKIVIKTPGSKSKEVTTVFQSLPAPQAQQASAPPVVSASAETNPAPPTKAAGDDSKYITIKSPMVGTFYRSPAPDKPTFINIGDEIATGKVICIIEAMKLFNEVESDIKGKIVKILVDDLSPVEYDQPLFLVDPS